MHDPMTVAHEIKYPKKIYFNNDKSRGFYRNAMITIWHVDPEKDGSDDSCGWFMRPKHGNKKDLEEIKKRFDFEWGQDETTAPRWFNFDGTPRLSVMAITLEMFGHAIHAINKADWEIKEKFLKKHLYDILYFAENNVDSMYEFITMKYGYEDRKERINRASAIVYGCILRWSRPWYKHPKWHVWHWKVQIHSLDLFKRWAFSRCCKCGKGFSWGYSPMSNSWNGTGPLWFRSEQNTYHSDCKNPKSHNVACGS